MPQYLDHERKSQVARLIRDCAEPNERRAMGLKINSRINALMEKRYLTPESFISQLEDSFRQLFNSNYSLKGQLKEMIEMSWIRPNS